MSASRKRSPDAARCSPVTRPSAWALLKWASFHRLASFALLQICFRLAPAFDSSAALLFLGRRASSASPHWLQPLIRWDTLHYLGAASPHELPLSESAGNGAAVSFGGYAFEHTLAFQGALPALLRAAGDTQASWSLERAMLVTTAAAWICSVLSPVLLFQLGRAITSDEHIAYVGAFLSIWSPSPATLLSPTPEPFFSCSALLGLCLLFPHKTDIERGTAPAATGWRLLVAGVTFAACTALRANGVLLAGFLLWQGIWSPAVLGAGVRARTTLAIAAMVSTIIACSPFLLGQLWACKRFCRSGRPWCDAFVPLVYSFVQHHYWGVGFLRYWTAAQLPNFALALPILAIIGYTVRQSWPVKAQVIASVLAPLHGRPLPTDKGPSLAAEQVPHLMFLWISGVLLLFFSHVQIALRFASPGGLPALWWATARLLQSTPSSIKQALLGWLVLWNAASLVLYAGFYPPA